MGKEYAMTKEYKAKIFKSGNSLALRLPKALGLKEGAEMVLREAHRGFVVEAADQPRRKLDISGFWGRAAGMIHAPEPRDEFEPRPSSLKPKP